MRIALRRAGMTGVAAAAAFLAVDGTETVGAKQAVSVARQVTADDQGHLHIVGGVTSNNGKCFKGVQVRVQMYKTGAGTWSQVGNGPTDGTGFYDIQVPDAEGRYRSVVPKVNKGGVTCAKDVSNVVRHKHGP